ncbi:MAG: hypothetical protein DHS20C05_24820 [Hyphococcus sp.]|nr:MAG: hypothetical protein DHS20C05_24820 [Marinicaulis sp.]
MKPAETLSHIETEHAVLQYMQSEDACVRSFDDERYEEGFCERR